MRWLTLSVVACLLAAVTSNHLHCKFSESLHTCSKSRNGRFFLDGHRVNIKSDEDTFSVECNGFDALDFEVLPYYTTAIQVRTVKLSKCPLPVSRSLADVLKSFNVKVQHDNETSLVLNNLPSEPPLASTHFTELEHLAGLEMKALSELKLSGDFLAGLQNLRSLKLTRVSLLGNASPSGLGSVLALPTALEKLQLVEWKEKQLPVLERCDSLRQLELYKPSIESLPERWVAACPNLEKITLKSADRVASLPSNLLDGAIALKRLSLTKCTRLKSLPERFLEGAPNLLAVDLQHNKFQSLSSEVFAGPALLSLSLYSNRLRNVALEALASLTTLIKLDVGHNPDLGKLCDENGYSSLRNLTQLKELSFYESGITHICRDWRESMTLLESLDLRDTKIKELTFADLQYKRDATVENAKVILDDASITGMYNAEPQINSIVFTEDDYKKALETPANDAPVQFIWPYDDLECDCKMYWTRKTMDIPNFESIISMERLKCHKKGYLKDITAEQICPEHAV